MKLHRRAFVFSTALAGTIALFPAVTALHAEDATIKLGIVSPMSGPNARYGAFSLRGAQLAAKEINAAGGVMGRKLEFVSGGQPVRRPAEGVSATKRIITF